MTEPRPVSVVIPTVGRTALLERCLRSIAACDPKPGEVVVVDQSGGRDVSELVRSFEDLPGRIVPSDRRNLSLGMNLGLRAARHDHVLVTHDDCRVSESWVAIGHAHVAASPAAVITGRVLAGGDRRAVPSTKDDPDPHDFTGETHYYALYANNMALSRSAVVDFGGFDERFEWPAEDNDFCYRWLRSGRSLRYEPDFVVWHDEWRTPGELRRLYASYARAQGAFYGKHIANGDLFLLRDVAGAAVIGLRSLASSPFARRSAWPDPRRANLPWLPLGVLEGWWRFSKQTSRRARR